MASFEAEGHFSRIKERSSSSGSSCSNNSQLPLRGKCGLTSCPREETERKRGREGKCAEKNQTEE